jgi:NAD(P)-dependent dehydrogenase (short-subunit alcohol dehydrogenase family)
MPRIPSRSVLITGCSSGIGLCLAHGLRARGYRVFAGVRKAADLAALTEQGFEALALDLDSSESIHAAAREALRRSDNRLYALINNGAFGLPGAVEDLSRAALRAQFETNVFGTQELTNLILPAMRAAGEGRIVQISSLLGIVGLAYRGAYSASKFALEALSDILRLELRGSGIEVVLIEPGPIATRFRANAYAEFKRWIDKHASPHRDYYAHVEARLGGARPLPFTLPPEAVLDKVLRALERRRPRARYPVTLPSHAFALLKRLLPARLLDAVLVRISKEGQR